MVGNQAASGTLDLDFWVLVSSGRFQVPTRKDTAHGSWSARGRLPVAAGVPEARRTCRAACQVLRNWRHTLHVPLLPASETSTSPMSYPHPWELGFELGLEAWVGLGCSQRQAPRQTLVWVGTSLLLLRERGFCIWVTREASEILPVGST